MQCCQLRRVTNIYQHILELANGGNWKRKWRKKIAKNCNKIYINSSYIFDSSFESDRNAPIMVSLTPSFQPIHLIFEKNFIQINVVNEWKKKKNRKNWNGIEIKNNNMKISFYEIVIHDIQIGIGCLQCFFCMQQKPTKNTICIMYASMNMVLIGITRKFAFVELLKMSFNELKLVTCQQ